MTDTTPRDFVLGSSTGLLAAVLVADARAVDAQVKSAAVPLDATAFATDHTLKPLGFEPAKLQGLSEKLDRYEHSYQMDCGAAAAKFVDAFFRNIRREEVGKPLMQARALLAAGKGS